MTTRGSCENFDTQSPQSTCPVLPPRSPRCFGGQQSIILPVVMGCNQSAAPLPTPTDSIKLAIMRNDRLKNIFKLMEDSHVDDLINAMTEKKMSKRESLFVRGEV